MLLDGGLATHLQRASGLDPWTSPSPWVVERPEAVLAAHRAFVAAGSRMVLTATFRALAPHLPASLDVAEVNRRAVELARASGARVAGSMGPASGPGRPWAAVDGAGAAAAWQAQARALAGADLLVVETLTDADEARAALAAVRPVWTGPLVISLCPRGDGRLPDGADPAEVARALLDGGADAVGVNCGDGPVGCTRALGRLAPVVARRWYKPNAGWPEPHPELLDHLAGADAEWVGGCCGVGPEVIAALAARLGGADAARP